MTARTWRRGAVWLAVAVALEIALYRLWPVIDDNDPPPTIEQQLALAAAVVLLTLPHLIAWFGRRRRWLLQVAGSLGIALTVVSVLGFSLIFFTIPLLGIPSVVYLVRGSSAPAPEVGLGGLTTAVIALAIGSAAAFFLTEDPRCSITIRRDGELVQQSPATCDPYNTGRLGPEVVQWSGSSDTIAWHESLISLALSGTAIGLCVRAREANDTETAPESVVAL